MSVHNTSNGELRLVKGEIVGEVGLIESVTEDVRKKSAEDENSPNLVREEFTDL